MVIVGIYLKGYDARIVTLTGSRENHSIIASRFNKLNLPQNPTQEDVEVFAQALRAHCMDNRADKIVVNRRATTGKGAGGAGTFLIEGILLSKTPIPVAFTHPLTIKATDRREAENKEIRPKTVDLGTAYDIAYEGLNQNAN